MAKTFFSPGVIVTSKWLNGSRQIYFDGQDLDWHYDPLGLKSLVTTGPDGLDNRYITLSTSQPTLSGSGSFITGQPISGGKVVSGYWNFGFDPIENPLEPQNFENSPRSYLTNLKYDDANGVTIPPPTIADKFAALQDSDLITKKVLSDQFQNLVVDNGTY